MNVDEGVFPPVCLENVRVNLLTDFTAECAPVDCPACEAAILTLLGLKPVLEADVVDVADAATALADREQRVLNYI